MSTWLYLRCDDHTPPIVNDCESGQHLYDLEQIFADIRNRDAIAAAVRDGFTHVEHYRRSTAQFLAAHPHCRISVVDEYGETHTPEGVAG